MLLLTALTSLTMANLRAETVIPMFHWDGQKWVELTNRHITSDKSVGEQRATLPDNTHPRSNLNYGVGPNQSTTRSSKP
jgi:hypothetical protein